MTAQTGATAVAPAPDFAAIKQRQQQTWASGDYAVVGRTLTIVSEQLCEAVDLQAGQAVLDVATGHGITALAAARRWGQVTAIDYVPALLDQARERAAAERLEVDFRQADAEALPFEAASFDVVLSTFGVMFAPNQVRAAAELLRVCRPGGTIGLASWAPDGFIGQVLRTVGKHVPPPAGVQAPTLWGTEDRLRELFGSSIADLRATRRTFSFRYRSPQHWLEIFRGYYGPVLKAFQALDESGQQRLEADLLDLLNQVNVSPDGTFVGPSDYLEVVATRSRHSAPDRGHPEEWR